jgi:pyridoxamine 5'-phosphate oxidase
MADLGDLRNEFTKGSLSEQQLLANPMDMFQAWLEEYMATNPAEPTAMTVATVDEQLRPWQRILLLKGLDERGFVFFTNMNSNKGQQLAKNPNGSLHFSWLPLERQVQVQGKITPVSRQESEQYFQSRPKESQLGALASDQSQPLKNRAVMEQRFANLKEEYADKEVILPDHWGGYRLVPERIEFWQGGAHRLHDRFEYVLDSQGWSNQRLYP